MYFLARFCLTASIAGLLLTLAWFTRPSWMADLKLDVWSLPELLAQIDAEQQRSARLGAFESLTKDRASKKRKVREELIAGKVSLATAAQRTLDLSDHVPEYRDFLERTWPGRSALAQSCLYLIQDVRRDGDLDPSAARAAAGRLQAEFTLAVLADHLTVIP